MKSLGIPILATASSLCVTNDTLLLPFRFHRRRRHLLLLLRLRLRHCQPRPLLAAGVHRLCLCLRWGGEWKPSMTGVRIGTLEWSVRATQERKRSTLTMTTVTTNVKCRRRCFEELEREAAVEAVFRQWVHLFLKRKSGEMAVVATIATMRQPKGFLSLCPEVFVLPAKTHTESGSLRRMMGIRTRKRTIFAFQLLWPKEFLLTRWITMKSTDMEFLRAPIEPHKSKSHQCNPMPLGSS
mmetsp:Transcript_67517/g.126283  ORF Transcript_67517/g.126283 Transcript_67517/m.126283 type:complete len:239 (-) Transcript_67517:127-843(-)